MSDSAPPSWEYETLSRNSTAIARALAKNNLAKLLADEMSDRGMIGETVHGLATECGPQITEYMRVKHLIDAMETKVELNQQHYHDFIKVLKLDGLHADAEAALALLPQGPSQASGQSAAAELPGSKNKVAAYPTVPPSLPPTTGSSTSTSTGATQNTLVLPSLPPTSTCTSSASPGIGETLGSRAELSPSSSETLPLSPESTSGSVSGSYREGLVPQGQTYTTRRFPYLAIRKLSSQKRLALECRLLKDSDTIMSEFGDLKVYTIESIASRGISVEKLYTGLSSFGAYGPNRKQVPLLQDQLDKLKRAEDVNAVFCILDDYYSFFNYGILEKLIGWFGTPKDKERLETYTESFKRFCKRRTFECPPDIFGHTVDKGKTNLVVKVGKSWDPMEGCSDPSEVCSDPSEGCSDPSEGCSDPSEGCSDPSEGCSLENVQRLRNSLADILKVEPETLYLRQINKGCVELLFQVPSFVEEDIFPLSMEQERSLTSKGVTRLTCGSYRFLQSPEALVPQTPAQAESEVKQKPLQKSRRERAEAHQQWAELQNVTPSSGSSTSTNTGATSMPPSLPPTSGSSTSASIGATKDTLSSQAAKFVSARELLTSSETVSLFPESTPGSISGSEHQVLVRKGQTDTSSSFPYLNIGELSSQARVTLESKLLKDSDNIMSEFGDLKHHTINSIVSRGISVKALHTSLSSLGAYMPVHKPVPLLRDQMDEIERAEDVRSVFCILDKYYSFFNYGILEKLIGWFGTPEDKERLETYTESFKRFCKRRIFECPPDIFGHTVDKGKTDLVVKVEESWDPREGCSLENVRRLCNDLAYILKVESKTLYLCRVDEGCIELLFQVPSFVEEDIFPLSMDQERSLTAVGVTRLTCGSYRFPQSPEALVPQMFAQAETEVKQNPLQKPPREIKTELRDTMQQQFADLQPSEQELEAQKAIRKAMKAALEKSLRTLTESEERPAHLLIKELQEQMEALKAGLAKSQKKFVLSEQHLQTLRKELKALNEALKAVLERELAESDQEFTKFHTFLKELKALNEAMGAVLERELAEADQEFAEFQTFLKEHEEQREALEAELEEQKAKNEAMEAVIPHGTLAVTCN